MFSKTWSAVLNQLRSEVRSSEYAVGMHPKPDTPRGRIREAFEGLGGNNRLRSLEGRFLVKW